jgi:hypothetical protein
MFDIIGGLADKSTRLAITREIIENNRPSMSSVETYMP